MSQDTSPHREALDGIVSTSYHQDSPRAFAIAEYPASVDQRTAERLMVELIKARKRKRIRQDDVARALGITQGRVSQVEKQPGEVRLGLILAYARFMNMELTWSKGETKVVMLDGAAIDGIPPAG